MLTTHATRTMFKVTFMASLGAIAQLSATSSYAAEASLVATANSNIVVQTTAQASLTLTPSTTVLAGKYSERLRLATWSAEVTAGSLALRLNPTIMKTITSDNWGTATSKESSSNTIPVQITTFNNEACSYPGGTLNSVAGWSVCNQGLLSSSGTIRISAANTTIAPGTYPLSMDVAVWAY